MRGPFHVDGVVDQIQSPTLMFAQGVELDDFLARAVVWIRNVAIARAIDVNLRIVGIATSRIADQIRSNFIRTIRYIDGMETLNEMSGAANCLFGLDDHI